MNQQTRQFDEPALYITAQTTIPLLTTVMLTFSSVMIAIASAYSTISSSLPFFNLSTRNVSLTTLVIAALLFAFTTEACVKSQGWDFYALTQERRDFDRMNKDPSYIRRCSNRCKLWHALAARAYNTGFFFQMLGVAFLVWPVASFVSVIIGIYLLAGLLVQILSHRAPDRIDRIEDRLEQLLRID